MIKECMMQLKRMYFLLVIFSGLVGCVDNNKHLSTLADNKDTSKWPASFGIGRAATREEIAAIDIDVTTDGHGLPEGSGNIKNGKGIYEIKCAACHGIKGTGGPFSVLVGTKSDTAKVKTIGNYWPYASTFFYYIRRAMPFDKPGSLSNDEVYSLTAYLLYKNRITDSTLVLNAQNLAKVKMPAQKLFVTDDRRGGPEVK